MTRPTARALRWIVRGAMACLGVFVAFAGLVGVHDLDVTRHEVPVDRPLAGAVRIVHLTDLHLTSFGSWEERVLAAVREAAPDLLVITGDSVNTPAGLPHLERFLAGLPEGVALLGIMGNWERAGGVAVGALSELFARHGGRLLINEWESVRVAGVAVAALGLDTMPSGKLMRSLAASTPEAALHLGLFHFPLHRKRLEIIAPGGFDLLLAGHTHGGQIALFGHAPFVPAFSDDLLAGWYRGGTMPFYISRGLGTSMLPLRFGARPEVAVITLTGK